MSLAPVEDEQDTGTDEGVRHAHCNICFPQRKFGAGSRVLALCGSVKTIRGDEQPGGAPPPNACIVCADPEMIANHVTSRHPEKVV